MKQIVCLFCLLFVAQVTLGQAPKQIKIIFPSEGERQVWIGAAKDPGGIKTPEPVAGTSIVLDAPDKGDGFIVFAHDKKTGNVAEKPLAEVLKSGSWTVDPKDEHRVFEMDFKIESEGKPVASAVIKAKAGGETRDALVSPSDKGKAVIYNVPVGPVEVVVDYKSDSGPKTTPAQTFEAKLGAGPAVEKVLTLNDKVESVPDAAAQPDEKGGMKSPSPVTSTEPEKRPEVVVPPNPAVSFFNLLIGLVVIGALGYFVWSYVKKNPKQVEDMLKKAGIGDPSQQQPVAPVAPEAPQPLKPIVLGDAGPVAAVTPVGVAVPSQVVANPRLVRPDGSVALLMEGSTVVGRDEGLGLSLVGESSVSRQHARCDRTGDEVAITDLGSTNGTYVNGARISGETMLRSGDSVQFGAVAFRFEA